jgi:peptide/nickel transport system permease protein
MTETVVPSAERPSKRSHDLGYWRDAWREMRHDVTAMIGLVIVVGLVFTALVAPLVAPHKPDLQFANGLTQNGEPIGPSPDFRLGTDQLGRDELSRLIYGARVSLTVGLGGNALAAVLGIVLGGLAAMGNRLFEGLIMRSIDVVLSFPILLLAIVLLAVTQPSIITITLIIGGSYGAYLSRIVFAQAISLKEREFVLAARTSGVTPRWILLRHIVPHVMPSVLVFFSLGTATAIQLEAALSYVGIGIQPPNASWGNMISDGQSYIGSAPWLVIFPGIAIMLAMIGFSTLGDGLRDALDPTLERRGRFFRAMGVR